jgi:hypothetical protein
VSLNPIHGKVYSIQPYVIKFVSDLWQASDLSWYYTVINLKLNQGRVRVMVVNNISVIWWQFFFIGGGKTGSTKKNHRPATSH